MAPLWATLLALALTKKVAVLIAAKVGGLISGMSNHVGHAQATGSRASDLQKLPALL
jgi:hypothetical protein